ncbi:MAG TPA: DUF4390 domain-containing protein [Thauera aminoaromatica]|uniref:DUF4390 domain-containing protein n=1 Tax=Thauera aminoaromatica TaxID=164330 RepID=UPI0002EDDDEA|nr:MULTISPECIES: DUF4390 domain-containing protein [Thauera]MDA0234575.1 DUF4390 domain-containing protein [Pseudomonadota bacterium]MBL8463045.1 DUF4390 domain-containing protein [Thauera sp.]MBP7049254.1 DUF4390 domain-containing protein [Thauera sp.]MBX3681680.1 DUF4390 domain-containing protein [Thauera sp.]MCK6397189.1 DUF4390 domain-containing protein [Thauera aminoaromatica]
MAALLLLWALSVRAESVIRSAEIVPGDGGYVLNADIAIDLNPRLIDVVTRGVSLYFTTEVLIERPRWYWLNETVARRSLDYRLYYHAITRSFRLSVGNLHQNFDELDEALRTMQRVRNWLVAETGVLQSGVSHEVSLRFRLDTSQLPKPFQVTAIGSNDWNVETEWVRWTFLPGAPGFR